MNGWIAMALGVLLPMGVHCGVLQHQCFALARPSFPSLSLHRPTHFGARSAICSMLPDPLLPPSRHPLDQPSVAPWPRSMFHRLLFT
jgi:hypothetical protein